MMSLICDAQDSHRLKFHFLQEFERLNISLLKYIPDDPDAKWCTLPALLQEYGVALPQNLQEMIANYVLFPGDEKPHNWESPVNPMPPSTSQQFQLGHGISLELAKNVSLYQLAEMITGLDTFQAPLLQHLQKLVFFKLHKSLLFDKYLRSQIKHCTGKARQPKSQSKIESSLCLPKSSQVCNLQYDEREYCVSMDVFVQSLKNTELFLFAVMKGDIRVTIKEIIDVQSLSVMEETSLIMKFSNIYNLDCPGISKSQRILKLCQWMEYIQNIQFIFHQYQLKNCIQDAKFTRLVSIINGLILEEITQDDADEMLKQIEEMFNINDMNYLKLLTAMGDSESFYKVLQENAGIALHHPVFQQLQHDTAVIDDLPIAISLMSIFDDKEQDVVSLLSRIFEVPNVQDCIHKLKNINTNLALVVQLFSDGVSVHLS